MDAPHIADSESYRSIVGSIEIIDETSQRVVPSWGPSRAISLAVAIVVGLAGAIAILHSIASTTSEEASQEIAQSGDLESPPSDAVATYAKLAIGTLFGPDGSRVCMLIGTPVWEYTIGGGGRPTLASCEVDADAVQGNAALPLFTP